MELTFIGPPMLRLPEELRRRSSREAGRLAREVDALDDAQAARRALRDADPEGAVPRPGRVREGEVRVPARPGGGRSGSGPDLKILHPLPRVNEVAPDVDALPGALYFEQARNGVTVRKALLSLILADASCRER